MAAEFFVEEGILSGVVLVLDEGNEWTIGRDPGQCNLLLEDPNIERRQLLCRRKEEGYTLQDVSDGKKSLLNGASIAEEIKLTDGDEITIEGVVLRFFEESIGPTVVHKETKERLLSESETIMERLGSESRGGEGDIPPDELEDLSDEEASEKEEGAFDDPLEEEEPVVDEPLEDSTSEPLPEKEKAPEEGDVVPTPPSNDEEEGDEEERELTEEDLPDEAFPKEELPREEGVVEEEAVSSAGLPQEEGLEEEPVEVEAPIEEAPAEEEAVSSAGLPQEEGLEEEPVEVEAPIEEAPAEEEAVSSAGLPQEENLEEEPVEDKVVTEEEATEALVDEEEHEVPPFEEVGEFHVDLTQTVRFILKVIAGPNTGAEFAIDTGNHYLIGTDTNTCDIVFHDLSVSREHAKLAVDEGGKATIEDLDSRNGVLVDQKKIKGEQELPSSAIVTIGTTSFFLIDKEAPQETIVTPIFEPPVDEEEEEEEEEEVEEELEEAKVVVAKEKVKPSNVSGAFVLSIIVIGFVCLLGFGIFTLSESKEVVVPDKNFGLEITETLKDFPAVQFSYNKVTQKLFLVGHVVSSVKMNELHYKLQGLTFLKGIEDNVVDDEAIWQEMNLLLAKRADFKGVSMHSPSPGVFVLTGYLKTDQQGAALTDYMNLHFNYLSNLQNRVVVEEQVNEEVSNRLIQKGFGSVEAMFLNGELTFTGYIGSTQTYDFDHILKEFGKIPGVRNLLNYVVVVSPEQQVVDLSMRYPGRFKVTGYSKHGDVNINVVINGRILTRGDSLDGMIITSIQPHTVFLEKEGLKYKIDYNK